MTRDEALRRVKGYLTDVIPAEDYLEVDEIMKALKPEPCSDTVSRDAVDELSRSLVHTTRDKADFLCNFWEGLQKLPPVTPQVKLEQSKQTQTIFPRREDATNKELILTIIKIQGYLSRYGQTHTNWHETLNEVVARLEQQERLLEQISVSEEIPEKEDAEIEEIEEER